MFRLAPSQLPERCLVDESLIIAGRFFNKAIVQPPLKA